MSQSNFRCPPEMVLPDFSDEEATTTTTTTKSRRVSFGTNLIKEFIVGSAVSAQCVSEYEQEFSSSDSSNPNSSHSTVENSALNPHILALEENHINQKSFQLGLMNSNSTNIDAISKQISKFSSTICFSADSPGADIEFTGGCINLAKSILEKKNKEMTLIISSKSKAVNDTQAKDETKFFEGSQFDMSMTNFFNAKDTRREEMKVDGERTKLFNDSEMSKLFTTRTSDMTNFDDSDMSSDDSCKENKIPLNMIVRQLDNDVSDVEDSLFQPKKSLNDVFKTGPLDVSSDTEKVVFDETKHLPPSICRTPEPFRERQNISDDSVTFSAMEVDCPAPVVQSVETQEMDMSIAETLVEEEPPLGNVNNTGTDVMLESEMDVTLHAHQQEDDAQQEMEMDSFISHEQMVAVEREMTMEMTKYAQEPMESDTEMSIEEIPELKEPVQTEQQPKPLDEISRKSPKPVDQSSSKSPKPEDEISPKSPKPEVEVSPKSPKPKVEISSKSPEPEAQIAPKSPEPEAQIPPKSPEPEVQIPPKSPEAQIPPKSPEAQIASKSPEAQIASKSPEPEFQIPPKSPEPEFQIPPKSPEPEFQIPPKSLEAEAQIPQKSPEAQIPPKSPEPEVQISLQSPKPEDEISPLSPKPEVQISPKLPKTPEVIVPSEQTYDITADVLESQEGSRPKSKGSLRKNPPLMDGEIVRNLNAQSSEPDCLWTLYEVKCDQNTHESNWNFRFKLLQSHFFLRLRLHPSEEDDLNMYSYVKSVDMCPENEENLKRREYHPTLQFGLEHMKKMVEQERKMLKTAPNVPFFLDTINSFAVKLNRYLEQVYVILTQYPGSTFTKSLLSFRLYSFPLLFSVTVSLDLSDLYRLSKESLSFQTDVGSLDERKIIAIFETCLKSSTPLTDFVLRANEYIIQAEAKTGRVTKRDHTPFLPVHLR